MPGQDSGYIGNLTKGGIFTTAPRGGLLLLEGRTPIHRVMRKARNSSRRVDLYSQRIMSKPPVVSFCVACVHCLPRLAVSIRIAHVSFVVQLSVLLREAPVPARITYLVATRYRHRAVAIRIPFVQCPVLPVCVGVARVCFSRSGCVAEQGNRNPPVSARGGVACVESILLISIFRRLARDARLPIRARAVWRAVASAPLVRPPAQARTAHESICLQGASLSSTNTACHDCQGSITLIPHPSKSGTFLVATSAPADFAMAAICASN